ncbi:Rz1-like lysis system protein LysC [Providencia sp. wls1922]|uniref:Rz1-like lysis system protein LysC n=1 Tax=Providencia sp. wls1922 TaxID=2675152 RepID=UPI0018A786E0|nr:peptidase [Providencia sp. wls1922]
MSQLRLLSKQCSKTMSALILLCPMMLLVSCASTKEKLVPVQPVPLPPHLIADCSVPVIPTELTYGDVVMLLADSLNELNKCNLDKKAIREIEAERLGAKNGNG